jgi:uncharacterized protein YkwD
VSSRRIGGQLLAMLLAAGLAVSLVGCGGTTACDCTPTPGNPLDADSNQIVQSLNASRMAKGVPTVTVCYSLNVSAAAHSDDMRDNGYLSDVSPTTMSTVRTRACSAMPSYAPACSTTNLIPMAELVAEGNGDGTSTYAQWSSDMTAAPILIEAPFVVVGVGHSIGATNEFWTLDLASQNDPSCTAP